MYHIFQIKHCHMIIFEKLYFDGTGLPTNHQSPSTVDGTGIPTGHRRWWSVLQYRRRWVKIFQGSLEILGVIT